MTRRKEVSPNETCLSTFFLNNYLENHRISNIFLLAALQQLLPTGGE
jgi:hypothetical protein